MDNLLNHLAETQVTFDEIDQIIDAQLAKANMTNLDVALLAEKSLKSDSEEQEQVPENELERQ